MAQITKPHGGYTTIPIEQLCIAWCAYREKKLSWLAVRVFLALHEVHARRIAAARKSDKSNSELHWPSAINQVWKMVGCARRSQVRQAVTALGELGIAEACPGLAATNESNLRESVVIMMEVTGRRGTIPVPRQVLRYVARCGTPAVAAYMLAVIIRCCHIRKRTTFQVRGRCSTRFAAELFDIHQRSIKRAAMAVRKLGWIANSVKRDPWSQKHGPVIVVNRNWRWTVTELSPRSRPQRTKLSPTNKNQELFTDPMNQESIVVSKTTRRRASKRASALYGMCLRDLREPQRLLVRYANAVKLGMLSDTQANQLRFVSAAQHALRVARRNACGVFVSLIRDQNWHYISQADEDKARLILTQAQNRPANQVRSKSTSFGNLVSDLVDNLAWPSVQVARNASIASAIRSKNSAGCVSPVRASSCPTTRNASTMVSMFSTNVV